MSNTQNTALGVVAGIATGALAGVLFAPYKGSKTRKIIKEKINDTGEMIVDEAENIRDSVAETICTNKETLDEQLEKVVAKSADKAEDIISSLEKKLATLKEQNLSS